ncbi:MAG: hypothetical protein ACFFD4_14380 [Candidatus Odinarchaeota archaeon]
MAMNERNIDDFVKVLVSRGLGIYGREKMTRICHNSGLSLHGDNTVTWRSTDPKTALNRLIINYSRDNLPAKMTAVVLARKHGIPLPRELVKDKRRKSLFRRKQALKSLWVVLKSGICIYHADFSADFTHVSEDLFSGFIAALFSFSTTLGGGGVQNLTMKSTTIHYTVTGDGKIIVAATGTKYKINKVQKILLEIKNAFEQLFPGEISLLDTKDPRFEEFTSEVLRIVKPEQATLVEKTDKGQLIERALLAALRGEENIDTTLRTIEQFITDGFSESERELLNSLVDDLSELAGGLGVEQEVTTHLDQLRGGVSDWLARIKTVLTKGW